MAKFRNKAEEVNIPVPTNPAQDTVFYMQDKDRTEVLKLCENGDIFVKGRLVENDKEVINAFREFLKSHGFLK